MNRLILTADQIYALAYISKADYLDYFYISLANRKNDDQFWLNKITHQLVSQGVISEDFSGNISIDPEIEALVKPLFFSDTESSLDINTFGETEKYDSFRFHFLDEKITMTKTVKDGFEIASVNGEEILDLLKSILPDDYSAESDLAAISFEMDMVSRVFIVKRTCLQTCSIISTFIEREDTIYEEDASDRIFSLSGTDFVDKLYSIIMGD